MTNPRSSSGYSRREFLKTSATSTLGVSAVLLGAPALVGAAPLPTLRVGLIGCGGRGTAAARDIIASSGGVDIVSLGDLFPDRLAKARATLAAALGTRFTVDDRHAFTGFDAYRKVLDSGVDLVILATPPGFRPLHLRAAVEAGKHVFTEKPVAVDPVGVRSVIASSDLAANKGLAIVAGTQRRHDPRYVETMRRMADGAIGEVVAGQVYWNMGGLWHVDRTAEMSDMEWQIRNWLYFTWLSGDHIVEQHVHNIDVANWALGGHPVRANGVGGRQSRVDPAFGHIFDHFAVELEYASGARIATMCRQQIGTAPFVGERFMGTLGSSDGHSWIRKGRDEWRPAAAPVPINPYVEEHRDLVASIREGRPLNEGRRVAESTLTAIMAREAAYTGQVVTWDEITASDLSLMPEMLAFGPLAVPPIAQPGVTKLSRPAFARAPDATSPAVAR
ncbi:MAG: Gfo/Idh/MocA family oxidoreductase [Gemmatimonadaceae bacterium]